MEKRNNKKNIIWNTIGLTLYSFISLFLLVIVKRINGMENAGTFTYAFSLSTLFFYVALYYNRFYQISNYNDNKTFNQLFSTRLLTSILSITIIIVFSIINNFNFFKLFIIFLLMLFRIIDAISDTFYGYEQENDFLYKCGISYSLKSILGFIFFTFIDLKTNNLLLACFSLVLINLIILYVYDFNNYRIINKNRIFLDFSNLTLILKEAFPIFIFSFLNVYLINSQKIILNYYVSNEYQTIFGILIMPSSMISLIASYLIIPFSNSISNLYKKKRVFEIKKLCNKIFIFLFLIGLIGLIVCFFIGIPLLNVVYSIDLWSYRLLLEYIIFGSIFLASSTIISNILTIFFDNIIQIKIYFIVGILSSIISVILIKSSGISGAVYSYLITNVISYLLFVIRYYYILNKIH